VYGIIEARAVVLYVRNSRLNRSDAERSDPRAAASRPPCGRRAERFSCADEARRQAATPSSSPNTLVSRTTDMRRR